VRPTSENGPNAAEPWATAKSCADHFDDIDRLRIATKPLVKTGSNPLSPIPVPLENDALE
jgi:hypothetical protein